MWVNSRASASEEYRANRATMERGKEARAFTGRTASAGSVWAMSLGYNVS